MAPKDVDKSDKYIRTWCPELRKVPHAYIYAPWKMPIEVQKEV